MFYADIPEVLYHYCSISSFFSIIKSKSLWLCNAFNMNDRYDSTYLESIVSRWLREMANKESNREKKIFYNACNKVLLNYTIERPIPYIACFSTEGDLLSQWVAYANQGTGVSIGFNTEMLLQYSVDNPTGFLISFDNDINSTLLINLEYHITEIKKMLEKLFNYCYSQYIANKEDIDILSKMAILFCGYIFRISALYKNKAFRAEHEWRCISYCASYYSNSLNFGKMSRNIEFECINGHIKSHISLDLREYWNDGLIKHVILGPQSNENEFDFKFFLSNNFSDEIEIRNSKIPYIHK